MNECDGSEPEYRPIGPRAKLRGEQPSRHRHTGTAVDRRRCLQEPLPCPDLVGLIREISDARAAIGATRLHVGHAGLKSVEIEHHAWANADMTAKEALQCPSADSCSCAGSFNVS